MKGNFFLVKNLSKSEIFNVKTEIFNVKNKDIFFKSIQKESL